MKYLDTDRVETDTYDTSRSTRLIYDFFDQP